MFCLQQLGALGDSVFSPVFVLQLVAVHGDLPPAPRLRHQGVRREGEWEYVLGGLETIDREFGYGVDELTHHITDCHVAHHMFSDMPHYNLPKATDGVRSVLEPRGLYKKRDTRDFVSKVFRLHKDVGHCVDSEEGVRPRATKEECAAAFNGEEWRE